MNQFIALHFMLTLFQTTTCNYFIDSAYTTFSFSVRQTVHRKYLEWFINLVNNIFTVPIVHF